MANYATTFEPNFSTMMRERRPTYLADMQSDAVKIEGNLITGGKIRRNETRNENYSGEEKKGKRKLKDEPNHPTYNKDTPKENIEEMTRLIRNLSNNISRLELEGLSRNQAPPPCNPNFIHRSFNPQKIHREKRCEDQLIQPLVRRDFNLQIEFFFDKFNQDEDINWVGDQYPPFYITKTHYTNSLALQESNDSHEDHEIPTSQYQ